MWASLWILLRNTKYPTNALLQGVLRLYMNKNYMHIPTFLKEFEKQLKALDLSTIRFNHKAAADEWVKEAVLGVVKRSLKHGAR